MEPEGALSRFVPVPWVAVTSRPAAHSVKWRPSCLWSSNHGDSNPEYSWVTLCNLTPNHTGQRCCLGQYTLCQLQGRQSTSLNQSCDANLMADNFRAALQCFSCDPVTGHQFSSEPRRVVRGTTGEHAYPSCLSQSHFCCHLNSEKRR